MIFERDILFYVGGAALRRYGRLVRTTAPAPRGGEDAKEVWTRAAPNALFVRRDGTLGYATTDLPRVERIDVDGDGVCETLALLSEGSRTNGWDRSEELDHANWSKTRCSISANATTAPDGTTSADRIVEDNSASTTHFVSRTPPTMTANTAQALSFFSRASERSWVRIVTSDKAGTVRVSWVNVSTGVVGTKDSGHTIVVRRFNLLTTAYFYRVEVQWNSGTGGSTPVVEFHVSTGDGVTSYTGDGTSGLYIWGLQFEADKANASSYIKTVSGTVTRAADAGSCPFFAGPQALTLYAKGMFFGALDGTTNYSLLTIGSESAGNGPYVIIRIDGGTNKATAQHDNGPTLVSSGNIGTALTPKDIFEIRGILATDGSIAVGMAVNGGAETVGAFSAANAFGSAWEDSKVIIGRGASGSQPSFCPLIAGIIARGAPSLDEFRALLPAFGPPYS